MQYTTKEIDKTQVELTITVEPTDYQADLQKAAVRISTKANIKGFRPGKAPFDIVKQEIGELKILEEAMQPIVEINFNKAIREAKLETIGMPQINIEKIAPGNDFVFKATVALMPSVKLGDIKKIKVKKEIKEVDNKKVEEVLESLRKLQTKEVIKNKKATKADKVTIDMEMFKDKVIVDGGSAKNHAVYLSEKHYIPGLDEQLVGLGKDDTKEFTLKFPKEHYQKHLAGTDVDFKIKVNEVYELDLPDLDNNFAQTLGVENVDKLKETLKANLTKEAEQKENQRIEIAIFDQLIADSELGEIPDVLLNSEKQRMFHELKHSLTQQGIDMEKYLADLKKTEEDIYKDFADGAAKRVKASLISRQIALNNKLEATAEEIKKEIELIKKTYPEDENIVENLKRQDVKDTLAVTIQNRKVVEWLKKQVIAEDKS